MLTLLWMIGRALWLTVEAVLLLFFVYAGFVMIEGVIRRGRDYMKARRRR